MDGSPQRPWNFCAGPAALPTEVLEQARGELLDWQGRGMSVMECSHRETGAGGFVETAARAEADLRALLGAGDDYAALFLQGGARGQFAAVPLNLLGGGTRADYVRSGYWSNAAIVEARRHCELNIAADGEPGGFTDIPPLAEWRLDPRAAYCHYTANETIHGVEFAEPPRVGEVPLVADMSSTLLSRPIELGRFGLIYASAQKNIGPAGLTVVLVRRDLLAKAARHTPSVLDYAVMDRAGSMHNTPPTWAWYVSGLVFQWLLRQGGLEEMAARNRRKAAKLYEAIDASDFWHNAVAERCRSWMNVPFTMADPALDPLFLAESAGRGLVNLKGHRATGGMRASLYNAMPEAGVDALVVFMQDFEKRHG